MAKDSSPVITQLLHQWRGGDDDALAQLVDVVHQELHRLARRRMNGERTGHTLQPTALVNEAFLRLVEIRQINWQDREHFFAVAARVMRRILVDSARARRAQKRGDGDRPVTLDELPLVINEPDDGLLDLENALQKLEGFEPRKVRVVELHFFTGLSIEETARMLDVSPRTVKRDWRFAKAWLSNELRPEKT